MNKTEHLAKEIREALASKSSQFSPWNLFELSEEKLKSCGYSLLKPSDEFQNGDMICATTASRDLWIFVDNAAILRKGLHQKEIGEKVIVYRRQ